MLLALRRYWLLVLVAVLAACGAAIAGSAQQTPRYTASARLLLASAGDSSLFSDGGDPERRVANEAERFGSVPVLTMASSLLDNRVSPEEISEAVRVEASAEADVISISATAGTASDAAELSNAVGVAYQRVLKGQRLDRAERAKGRLLTQSQGLQRRISNIDSRLRELRATGQGGSLTYRTLSRERSATFQQLLETQAQSREISVDAAFNAAGVELFEPAEVPTSPSIPQTARNTAIAGVFGLMIGSAIAWRLRENDEPVVTGTDVTELLGAPNLARIPASPALRGERPIAALSGPEPAAAAAYDMALWSIVTVLVRETGARSVLVTSPRSGEGRTVAAANIAVAASQNRYRTTIVDADVKTPHLSELTGVASNPGITDLSQLTEEKVSGQIGYPSSWEELLRIVPAGTALSGVPGLFNSAGFRFAMLRIRDASDLVIVDGPALLEASDSVLLAAAMDAVLLLVSRSTHLDDVRESAARLQLIQTPVLGFIYNDVRTDRPGRRVRREPHLVQPVTPSTIVRQAEAIGR